MAPKKWKRDSVLEKRIRVTANLLGDYYRRHGSLPPFFTAEPEVVSAILEELARRRKTEIDFMREYEEGR